MSRKHPRMSEAVCAKLDGDRFTTVRISVTYRMTQSRPLCEALTTPRKRRGWGVGGSSFGSSASVRIGMTCDKRASGKPYIMYNACSLHTVCRDSMNRRTVRKIHMYDLPGMCEQSRRGVFAKGGDAKRFRPRSWARSLAAV